MWIKLQKTVNKDYLRLSNVDNLRLSLYLLEVQQFQEHLSLQVNRAVQADPEVDKQVLVVSVKYENILHRAYIHKFITYGHI